MYHNLVVYWDHWTKTINIESIFFLQYGAPRPFVNGVENRTLLYSSHGATQSLTLIFKAKNSLSDCLFRFNISTGGNLLLFCKYCLFASLLAESSAEDGRGRHHLRLLLVPQDEFSGCWHVLVSLSFPEFHPWATRRMRLLNSSVAM